METNEKLTAGQVRYLSFEGGGGKGAAYLGALAALAHPDIGLLSENRETGDYHLTRRADGADVGVEGVAGASAGAITAAFLASGWGVRELHRDVLTDREALAGFFDPASATRRLVPVAAPQTDAESVATAPPSGCVPVLDDRIAWLAEATAGGRTAGRLMDALQSTVSKASALSRAATGARDEPSSQHPAVRQLWAQTGAHLRDLVVDYGLFSGCAAREFLDTRLARGGFVTADAAERPSDTADPSETGVRRNLTLAEHSRRTGVDLVVTGTNLRTGRAAYLSARHGPESMAVADAVRISMGLPVVFKPVRIDADQSGFDRRYEGLWVDGGVLNNNPIHAFDVGGVPAEGVLGLRLEEESTNDVDSLTGYLRALATTYTNAAETREIRSAAEEARCIVLPVPAGTLSLLDFTPDDEALWEAAVAAANSVLRYFEVDDDPSRLLEDVLRLTPPPGAESA